MRARWAVAVVGTLALMGVMPATSAEGAVTLDCEAKFAGTWPNGASFRGDVRPTGPRTTREAKGQIQHTTPDGEHWLLSADFLKCRRDGGLVPPSGGANVADFDGTGLWVAKGRPPVRVLFHIHVEDRGQRRDPNTGTWLDFYAVQLTDEAGNQLAFDANYLQTGDVDLIPTELPE